MTQKFVIWSDSQNGYWTGTEFLFSIDSAQLFDTAADANTEIGSNSYISAGRFLVFETSIKV